MKNPHRLLIAPALVTVQQQADIDYLFSSSSSWIADLLLAVYLDIVLYKYKDIVDYFFLSLSASPRLWNTNRLSNNLEGRGRSVGLVIHSDKIRVNRES